jgi:hypothetical protein
MLETSSNMITFVCIARVMGLQYSLSGSGIPGARSAFHISFASATCAFPMPVSSGFAVIYRDHREPMAGQKSRAMR